MLSISVVHPDAEHFIDAKLETGQGYRGKYFGEDHRRVHESGDRRQGDSRSNTPLKRNIPRSRKPSGQHSGGRSSTMPGNLLNPESCSGIQSGGNRLPDCYADLGFKTVSTNPCGEIPLWYV